MKHENEKAFEKALRSFFQSCKDLEVNSLEITASYEDDKFFCIVNFRDDN